MERSHPTQDELKSFCEGMYGMYEYCQSQSPDTVLFPLRGAFPFSQAYSHLAYLNGDAKPSEVLLPLGTLYDSSGYRIGLDKNDKFRIISEYLDEHFSPRQAANSIVLVDEVSVGGTINTHYNLTKRYLEKRFPSTVLKACAIEVMHSRKNKGYLKKSVEEQYMRIPVKSLFVMDNHRYLPRVEQNEIGEISIFTNHCRIDQILEEIEKMF